MSRLQAIRFVKRGTPCVYFLKRGPVILYIGASKTLFSRIYSHIHRAAIPFDSASFRQFKTLDAAKAMEKKLIRKHNPEYNVQEALYYKDRAKKVAMTIEANRQKRRSLKEAKWSNQVQQSLARKTKLTEVEELFIQFDRGFNPQ